MLDEHIVWNDHIHAIENKLVKNIGLLHSARQFLDKESCKTIYFSYIHSYLNYANIVCPSTYFTKLRTIHYQQKHAAKIIFNEDILTHSRSLTIGQCFKYLPNKFISSCQLYVQISKNSDAKNI